MVTNKMYIMVAMVFTLMCEITTVKGDGAGKGYLFFATMSNDVNSGSGDIIKFTKVIINKGNNYSKYTGAYTVPQDGTYVFTVQITATNHDCRFFIMVDDEEYIHNALSTPSSDSTPTATSTVTVDLKEDQVVRVKNEKSSSIEGKKGSAYQSYFTGYMLYAD